MSKKNLSVLSLNKKIISDEKINDIYIKFKKKLNKFKNKSFIVAVSGGPDSLALTALSRCFEIEKKIKFYYVLVDHRIRKDSSRESLKVKKLLKKNKINLNILINKKKIINNIQSGAREVRYKLLLDFSKKKKSSIIITAHHSDDQIETFLIRLSRGSGVRGLSSMQTISILDKKVTLVRPLLDFKKKELQHVSKKIFGQFLIDPSNKNQKYLRTKMRNLISNMNKNGISNDQILKSIQNLSSTNKTLNLYLNKIFKLNVKKIRKGLHINLKKILLETDEVQIRILSKAIKDFSKSYYPPRSKKVISLIRNIKTGNQRKFTLSGCIIEKAGTLLVIRKEA